MRRESRPPRVRRFWQYSLRTLLIVVTVVCACLAVVYYYVEPWLADRAAARAIAEAGGSCEMSPEGPDFVRAWFGPDALQRITAVESQPEATAACLSILPRLRRLEKATLAGAKFTDEQLAVVGQFGRLRELTLRGTTVTAEHIAELRAKRPNLALKVEPLEITFENDLRFEQPKGKPFSRDQLTERVRCLDGSQVRIRGFMLPTFKQFGLHAFVIVWDNMTNSFGPGAPLCEVIVVETRSGVGVDFSISPITLEGRLSFDELKTTDGQMLAIYRLTDAVVPVRAAIPKISGRYRCAIERRLASPPRACNARQIRQTGQNVSRETVLRGRWHKSCRARRYFIVLHVTGSRGR